MTGTPTVSVSIEASQSSMALKTIFDYLSQSKRQVYVAIDEFQQINKMTLLDEAVHHVVTRNAMQYEELITFLSDKQL